MGQEELLHALRTGGATIIIMIVCSVLAVMVALERIWAHRVFSKRFEALASWLREALDSSSLEEISKKIKQDYPATVGGVFLAGIEAKQKGAEPQKVEAAVGRARQRAVLALRKALWILGSIGSTAPFIGLFGTVYGIMKAMKQIEVTGDTGFQVVAGGISEALVTTAVGIAVAIEAVVLFNAIQNRLQGLGIEIRLYAEEFVEKLNAKQSK
jgi:biopolymer transport protein ExbB